MHSPPVLGDSEKRSRQKCLTASNEIVVSISMNDNLNDRFAALQKLCVLLAFCKPRAVEVLRTGERSLSVRSHKDNIGQYIGSKGAHFKALECIASHVGFTFEVQDKPDHTAFTQTTCPVVPQDVLEDILSLIAGKAITAEVRKVKDVHKFVCAVPRQMFNEQLKQSLDVIFFAAAFSNGAEKGVVLLPE